MSLFQNKIEIQNNTKIRSKYRKKTTNKWESKTLIGS
jgi:hypothetical protein